MPRSRLSVTDMAASAWQAEFSSGDVSDMLAEVRALSLLAVFPQMLSQRCALLPTTMTLGLFCCRTQMSFEMDLPMLSTSLAVALADSSDVAFKFGGLVLC